MKLTWGINLNGDIKHISEVPNGNKCQCLCIECGGALRANQGEIKTWYFSHQVETNCSGESIIHFLAKKIIEDASKSSDALYLPYLKGELESYCDLDERHVERWHYKKIFLTDYTANSEVRIDDVVVDVLCEEHNTGQLFAIEIYRTHKKDDIAISKFEQKHLMSIEIDLSELELDISKDELKNNVLKTAPRRWIFNSEEKSLIAGAQRKLEQKTKYINIENFNKFLTYIASTDIFLLSKNIKIHNLEHEETAINFVGKRITHKKSEPLTITKLTTPLSFNSDKRIAHATAEINHRTWHDIFFIIGADSDFIYDTPKPYIVAMTALHDDGSYRSKCEMRNIVTWRDILKKRTLSELNDKISFIENDVMSFSIKSDKEKTLYLCASLDIAPPIFKDKYSQIKPYWNASGYTWRLALYKYHLSRDNKINCELLSKDKILQKRFNFPEDEESRRRRSIDIYFWLRDIIANKGLVYHSHKLTYQIKTGCKLKNKINTISDLL
ncbi:hypothetical protein [Aeromonas enteropelogenes]|uniref:hypothetical protein n=1 Tax=Aeromonas enteropelogenes TaxID=29489 RepID=UPI0012E95D92|nr:hypothetical protein [Aeromonas enteropelogenes]